MVNLSAQLPQSISFELLVVADTDRIPHSVRFAKPLTLITDFDLPHTEVIFERIAEIDPDVVVFDCLDAIPEIKEDTAKNRLVVLLDDQDYDTRNAHLCVNAVIGEWQNTCETLQNGTILAQGPEYMIVNQGIITSRHTRDFANGLNILISLGGTDPTRSTLDILTGLSMIKEGTTCSDGPLSGKKFSINVLVDSNHPDFEMISDAARKADAAVGYGVDIVSILSWADIAITGGGILAFEALCTGAPCFPVPHSNHEQRTVRLLEERNLACPMKPNLPPSAYADILCERLADSRELERLAAAGPAFLDGQGARRIIELMLGLSHQNA